MVQRHQESDVPSLERFLAGLTGVGTLVAPMEDGWIRCVACGHRCKIAPGHKGICKVRFNEGGELRVPRGYVAGLAIDPIEKKPFFHVLPGHTTVSYGMLGCDFRCGYCQNWLTSQALRDPSSGTMPEEIRAEEIVSLALRKQSPMITSTYNEPLITSEWSGEVFRLAKEHGLRCAFVSNGNGTPEVIRYFRGMVDCFKVDLKSFSQKNYQQLGGRLQNVLDTIVASKEEGFWVEVVTLVVPGFNDSEGELRDIARFLASTSRDIPWHVTAFHPEYQMMNSRRTPAQTLLKAAAIGQESGLRFVYAGNLPGMTGNYENTYCPTCGKALIERQGFVVLSNHLQKGMCPECATPIAGIWQ